MINLEFATKKTYSEYLLQASIQKELAPYKVMDDFKLATTLDPCFKMDWCQNNESHDVCDPLTSQVVQLSQCSFTFQW